MNPNERIRTYRRERSIPPAELARSLGIAEPTLRSIENGHRKISAELAVKVEAVTGIGREVLRPDIFGPAPGIDPPLPTTAPGSSHEAAA